MSGLFTYWMEMPSSAENALGSNSFNESPHLPKCSLKVGRTKQTSFPKMFPHAAWY